MYVCRTCNRIGLRNSPEHFPSDIRPIHPGQSPVFHVVGHFSFLQRFTVGTGVLYLFIFFVSGYVCQIKLTTLSFLVHIKLFYHVGLRRPYGIL